MHTTGTIRKLVAAYSNVLARAGWVVGLAGSRGTMQHCSRPVLGRCYIHSSPHEHQLCAAVLRDSINKFADEDACTVHIVEARGRAHNAAAIRCAMCTATPWHDVTTCSNKPMAYGGGSSSSGCQVLISTNSSQGDDILVFCGICSARQTRKIGFSISLCTKLA